MSFLQRLRRPRREEIATTTTVTVEVEELGRCCEIIGWTHASNCTTAALRDDNERFPIGGPRRPLYTDPRYIHRNPQPATR